jgi:SAM-dependent methyltransferase
MALFSQIALHDGYLCRASLVFCLAFHAPTPLEGQNIPRKVFCCEDIYMIENQYTDGAYLEKSKGWHASEAPWKSSKVLQMIEKHHLSFNSICDVGCGVGEILVEIQKKTNMKVELTGFDISPQAIDIAKQKENATLKFNNEDFMFTESPLPDLVLLLDVFEHVPDYIGFLEHLRKKTDWIIFHIPLDICAKTVLRQSKWMLYMRETYGHLHYFTADTALATLSDIGYDIVDYFYTDDFEITKTMIPKTLRPRMGYEIRKYLFRVNPRLAASVFEQFNILLLARGDRKASA